MLGSTVQNRIFKKILPDAEQPWALGYWMTMWRQTMSQKIRVVQLSKVEFC